jgi:DNA mismatch repair ATPase MutS
LFLRKLRISIDNLGTAPFIPPPVDPDEMIMDAQTYKDLEIFEAEGGAQSVFDLCNATRTDGGARALRARMKKPFSSPAKIRSVQESLSSILEHRLAFERLPSDVVTNAVEKYIHGSLPLVASDNPIEVLIGSLEIRFGEVRPWTRIVRGVQATSAMIRSLRRLLGSVEMRAARGSVSGLVEEMRALLARPALAIVPAEERWDLPSWTILRIDRVLRHTERATVERLLHLLFEVDALVSLAEVVQRSRLVMPEIVEGPLAVEAEAVTHPFIEDAVANPVALDQARRMLFLTGPNMAGKTTYLRACGIALYLAHLGMGVPARSFRFSPCQRLFSSITVHDNVRNGVSFFRAEALRVKAIAQAVTDGYRVVALMDEPFKGTNVKDALDASRAILERFAAKEGSIFLVSSHLIELGEQMVATGQVDCRHFEAGEQEGRLRFEYVLRPGVSTQRLGMRVLREEGIFALLDGETVAAAGGANGGGAGATPRPHA